MSVSSVEVLSMVVIDPGGGMGDTEFISVGVDEGQIISVDQRVNCRRLEKRHPCLSSVSCVM